MENDLPTNCNQYPNNCPADDLNCGKSRAYGQARESDNG